MVARPIETLSFKNPSLILRLGVVLVGVFLFQEAVLNSFSLYSVHIDVSPVVFLLTAFLLGPEAGCIVGFISGVLFDSMVNTPFGLSSFASVLIGYFAGLLFASTPTPSKSVIALGAGIFSVIYELTYAWVSSLLGQPDMFSDRIMFICLLSLLGSTIAAIFLVEAVGWALYGKANPYKKSKRVGLK